MTPSESRPIVCATRGGQASRRTQERAIALAQERSAPLIFLFVTDPSFAGLQDGTMQAALTDELLRMGRSLLCIAEARAEKQGQEAHKAVKCGASWETIEEYLQQVNASTLIIGMPQSDAALQASEPGEVHRFAEKLRQTTDVEVIVVE
jgi:nucleotide-binding universal stress UspA family protein